MLKFQIYQSQLKGTSAYGKYFARIVTDQSLDIDGLATHMADHNTPFSRGTIKGILEDAVGCIKELLLDGKRVQLNNLVSFGLGIEHTEGADTADKFSVQRNVKSVKLIAQGIGSFSKSTLTSGARLAENRSYVSPKSGGPSTEPETPGGGNTPDTLEDFQGTNPMTGRALFCAARNLALLQEFCAQQGTSFLFVCAPNKNTSYPEYMPPVYHIME